MWLGSSDAIAGSWPSVGFLTWNLCRGKALQRMVATCGRSGWHCRERVYLAASRNGAKTAMGWVQRDSRESRSRGVPAPSSSFARLTDEELETHLNINRYGDFTLPGAIRPSYDLEVIPIEGYRRDYFRDDKGTIIPVLMAAVSQERLFDVFLDLLDPLDPVVDVVLETSHERSPGSHQDLYREQIDLPVLKSILLEFEDLLVNDGCTGVAVLNPRMPAEVQFDEHKLLVVYAYNLRPFEKILMSYEIPANPRLRFITEAEHVHTSSEVYQDLFDQLRMRLGLDRPA